MALLSSTFYGQNSLHKAFQKNDRREIKLLINDSINLIYEIDKNGHTPLYFLFKNLKSDQSSKSLKIFIWVKQYVESSDICLLQARFYRSWLYSSIELNTNFGDESLDTVFNKLKQKNMVCSDSLNTCLDFEGYLIYLENQTNCNSENLYFEKINIALQERCNFIPTTIQLDSVLWFKSNCYYRLANNANCKSNTDPSYLDSAISALTTSFHYYEQISDYSKSSIIDYINQGINLYFLMKDLHQKNGDTAKQIEAIKKAIDLFEIYIPLENNVELHDQALIDQAQLYIELYNLEGQKNIERITDALNINKKAPQAGLNKNSVLLQRAQLFGIISEKSLMAKSYDKAQYLLDSVLQINQSVLLTTKIDSIESFKQRVLFYITQSVIYYFLHQPDLAFKELDSALKLNYIIEPLTENNSDLLCLFVQRTEILNKQSDFLNVYSYKYKTIRDNVDSINRKIELLKNVNCKGTSEYYYNKAKSFFDESKNYLSNNDCGNAIEKCTLALEYNQKCNYINQNEKSQVLQQRFEINQTLAWYYIITQKYDIASEYYIFALKILDVMENNKTNMNDFGIFYDRCNILSSIANCHQIIGQNYNYSNYDTALIYIGQLESYIQKFPKGILSSNEYYSKLASAFTQHGNIISNKEGTIAPSLIGLLNARAEYQNALASIDLLPSDSKEEIINNISKKSEVFTLIGQTFFYTLNCKEFKDMSKKDQMIFVEQYSDSAMIYYDSAMENHHLIGQNFSDLISQSNYNIVPLKIKKAEVYVFKNQLNDAYLTMQGAFIINDQLLDTYSSSGNLGSFNIIILEQRYDLYKSIAYWKGLESKNKKLINDILKAESLFKQAELFYDSCWQIAEEINIDCMWMDYYKNTGDLYYDNLESWKDTLNINNALKSYLNVYDYILKADNFGHYCLNFTLFNRFFFYSNYANLLIEVNDTIQLGDLMETAYKDLDSYHYDGLIITTNISLFKKYKNCSVSALLEKTCAKLAEYYYMQTENAVKDYKEKYPKNKFGLSLSLIDHYYQVGLYHGFVKDDFPMMWNDIIKLEEQLEIYGNSFDQINVNNQNEIKGNFLTHGKILSLYELKIHYYSYNLEYEECNKVINDMETYINNTLFSPEIWLNHSDSLSIYTELALLYHVASNTQQAFQNDSLAIALQMKSIDFATQSGDHDRLGLSYVQMAILKSDLKMHNEAIEYRKKAIQEYKITNNEDMLSYNNLQIGSEFMSLGSCDRAVFYFEEGKRYATEQKDVYELNYNICAAKLCTGEFDDFLTYVALLQNSYNETFVNPLDKAEAVESIALLLFDINSINIPRNKKVNMIEASIGCEQSAKVIYDSLEYFSKSNETELFLKFLKFVKFTLSDLYAIEFKNIDNDGLRVGLKRKIGIDAYNQYEKNITDSIYRFFIALNSELFDILNKPYLSSLSSFEQSVYPKYLIKTFMNMYNPFLSDSTESFRNSMSNLFFLNALHYKKSYATKNYDLRQIVYDSGNKDIIQTYSDLKNVEQGYYKFLGISNDPYNLTTLKSHEFSQTGKNLEYYSYENRIIDSIIKCENLLFKQITEKGLSKLFETPSINEIREALDDNQVAIEFINLDMTDDVGLLNNRLSGLSGRIKEQKVDSSLRQTCYYAAVIMKEWEVPRVVKLFTKEEFDVFEKRISGDFYNEIESLQSSLVGINNIDAPVILKIIDNKIARNLPEIINMRYTGVDSVQKHSLYSLIWEPLRKHLDKNDTIIYYSPYGSLNNVSFNAIKKQDGSDHFLIDDYQLIKLSSTADIINLKQEKNEKPDMKKMLAFRDIDYGVESPGQTHLAQRKTGNIYAGVENNCGFPPYRFKSFDNRYRTDILNNILDKGFTDINGKNATRGNFIKYIGESLNLSVLLIATHGYYYNCPEIDSYNKSALQEKAPTKFNDPLTKVGLVFANANDKSLPYEDYIIDGAEISKLMLPLNELTILAACESGLGDNVGSEGVFGFQRSFKNAGAKYVLSSLWSVNINTSNEFLEFFLNKYLNKPSDIHKAYREAILSTKEKHPNPFYWAAYDLIR